MTSCLQPARYTDVQGSSLGFAETEITSCMHYRPVGVIMTSWLQPGQVTDKTDVRFKLTICRDRNHEVYALAAGGSHYDQLLAARSV